MALPKEISDRIESEARNYAWRNYVSKADNPNAEYENINTWPDDACYSYYSLLYYLNGDNPAQPVQGIFSAHQLHTLQQENADVKRRLVECEALLFPLLEYGQSKEAEFPLGSSVTDGILARAKDYERLHKALEKIQWFCAAHHEVHNDNISNIWEIANAALAAQPEAETDNQQKS